MFKNAHYLMRFGGHFGSSATVVSDLWSSGLRFGLLNSDSPLLADATLDSWLSSAETAINAFHSTAGAKVGTYTFYSWVSLARVGTDGKYDPLTQVQRRKDRTPSAGVGTPVHPWSAALVCSLRTTRSRGYASNGRCYYPATSIGINSSTGRVLSSDVGTRLAAFKVLLDALNVAASAASAGQTLNVYSGVGSGETAAVRSIRMDERLDAIERRENAIPPTWTSVALV